MACRRRGLRRSGSKLERGKLALFPPFPRYSALTRHLLRMLGSTFARPRRLIMTDDRRRFLTASATLGIGTLALSPALLRADDKPKDPKKDQQEEEVGATEDLMREHGVLNRILL